MPEQPDAEIIPGRCPQCGRPRLRAHRPFCSKRCRELDLHAWLDERYRVPVVEEDGAEEMTATARPDRQDEKSR